MSIFRAREREDGRCSVWMLEITGEITRFQSLSMRAFLISDTTNIANRQKIEWCITMKANRTMWCPNVMHMELATQFLEDRKGYTR